MTITLHGHIDVAVNVDLAQLAQIALMAALLLN
jgi:hypothetical protein